MSAESTNLAVGTDTTHARSPAVRTLPRSRPVMQMLRSASDASESRRQRARDIVLKWAVARWPDLAEPLSRNPVDLDVDQPGFKAGIVDVSDRAAWAFRVEHLDTQVAGRAWVVEVVVSYIKNAIDVFGVRTQCTAVGAEDVPCSSPAFLKDWAAELEMSDGRLPIDARALDVQDEASLQLLSASLLDPTRELPIVAISQMQDDSWPISPDALARRTVGLAHVVKLRRAQADELIFAVGRDRAVFNGAVRTFLPGFALKGDFQIHTNVLASRIATWLHPGGSGPGAFSEYLVAQLHRRSVSSRSLWEQVPSFLQIRRTKLVQEQAAQSERIEAIRRRVERGNGEELKTQVQLLEARLAERELELRSVQIEREELQTSKADLELLFEELASELDATRQQRDALDATNTSLREGLKRKPSAPAAPDTYPDLIRWIDENLSERMVLLPRARRALKDARYQSVEHLRSCLEFLFNEYWSFRTAEADRMAAAKIAFEQGLQALQIDEAPSISQTSLGKLSEQYTVSYQIGYTPKQVLDRHIRGGSSTRDERFCLRIYYFWDDERQKVVIGHLPSHLDTLST